jgi:RNA polymerase sigma-70 factor (ECF subfamily)
MAPHEAEDAAQAVWEKVFRALHRFDPEGAASLRSWIGTVTRRHLIDMHRRGGTRGEVIELGEMASATPSIDARLDAAKQAARLEVALTKLPEAQRRAVVFHHLQGQALDTLAEEEGVAVGTLKSRLHRGRARLAQLLGAKR